MGRELTENILFRVHVGSCYFSHASLTRSHRLQACPLRCRWPQQLQHRSPRRRGEICMLRHSYTNRTGSICTRVSCDSAQEEMLSQIQRTPSTPSLRLRLRLRLRARNMRLHACTQRKMQRALPSPAHVLWSEGVSGVAIAVTTTNAFTAGRRRSGRARITTGQ